MGGLGEDELLEVSELLRRLVLFELAEQSKPGYWEALPKPLEEWT